MAPIVARWEWRTFGHDFGAAESRFAALGPGKVQNSAETYLLASGSDANVKIRDELMDIKILERVDSSGLEQWRPVFKEPFPLAAAAVAQVQSALGVTHLASSADGLALERLLRDLGRPDSRVRVVAVRKTRNRYQVQGCVAELTDVVADGKPVRTVAIEDADPARVIAAVAHMGLDRFPNISYPRGLKQLIGMSNRESQR
jgi:exopolyphosphatase / guanosine-5'-triphosphate,3'-diphosphate pyrophosphatase